MEPEQDYPRAHARTLRFTLGRPRSVSIAPDGTRVLFVRSAGPADPAGRLWCLDVASGTERLLVDPADLASPAGATGGDLPAEERARRERAREQHGGIVAYGTDRALEVAAFALDGRLFRVDVTAGSVTALDTVGPAVDPRPDPTGTRIAYVTGGAVHVTDTQGADRALTPAAEDAVTWGLAEFVAAEEMGRGRGYWWSPDGQHLTVARVDESQVGIWHLADPATPAARPRQQRYPAAGTDNADVRLFVFGVDGGDPVEVAWDRAARPYVADVTWRQSEPLTVVVQARDQRSVDVLTVHPDTGATTPVRSLHDRDWVALVPGSPRWLPDGRLVTVEDVPPSGPDDPGGTRRVLVDGRPATPPGLQVCALAGVDAGAVWLLASGDPTETHVHRLDADDGAVVALTSDPGVHGVTVGGGLAVTRHATPGADRGEAVVRREGRAVGRIRSLAARAPVEPRVEMLELGERRLRAALLRPAHPPSGPLPVLLDPYGGPTSMSRRVVRARGALATSQWFADQGFAVLVVDGRGTPCRSPAWERAIGGDLAGPPLQDQVDALAAAGARYDDLDLGRVGIRGWSFGGFLAACAVLRRPDVFHAAVAGAPVTDWHLYDTHYTERYLGHPADRPDAYRRSSLVDPDARLLGAGDGPVAGPDPALLVIHGMADDNVVAAHSLRLSAALLAAGRPHSLLPLTGVTHMTPQVVVAENLLRLQASFLRQALGVPGG